MVDQLTKLHFTACHTAAIVSLELTRRKIRLSDGCEANKLADKLKAELEKSQIEAMEFERFSTPLKTGLAELASMFELPRPRWWR